MLVPGGPGSLAYRSAGAIYWAWAAVLLVLSCPPLSTPGLTLSPTLQSSFYGMKVWGLTKFSEAKWEVQGRQRKEGKPTDHRRKPRELSWHLKGPGHLV